MPITDDLLQVTNIKIYVDGLQSALFYKLPNGTYRTIHYVWDIEFISYLLTGSRQQELQDERYEYFRNAIESIFSVRDEKATTSVIAILYDIATFGIEGVGRVPIDIVDKIISSQLPDYLSKTSKSYLYSLVMAYDYIILQKFEYALEKCNRGLEIDPDNAGAWYNKSLCLEHIAFKENVTILKQYHDLKIDKAIDCYDKAISIDPNHAAAWNNRGTIFAGLYKYNEATRSFEEALRADPKCYNSISSNSFCLYMLGRTEEADLYFDKALKINPNDAHLWERKGESSLLFG